jgi:hypothetical protein
MCTPCSAAQPPCPNVRPRARATRMHVFSGRSVQRWPRTRRSSDPLQMRPSGPHFLPKAQIDHRELESGVEIRVRSRPGELAGAAAAFSTSALRPCRLRPEHLARQAGHVQPVALRPTDAAGHRQTTRTTVGEAVLQVSMHYCITPCSPRLRCFCCASTAHDGRSHRCGLCCVFVLLQPPFPHLSRAVAT